MKPRVDDKGPERETPLQVGRVSHQSPTPQTAVRLVSTGGAEREPARSETATRSVEAGPPAAAPWYIANSVTPPADVERRRVRYQRRQRSSEWLIRDARQEAGLPPVAEGVTAKDESWVRPLRPARCRWRVGEVMVHGGEGHAAHFSGTERCASIWACPVCSAVIRNERSADIEQAIKAHQAAGGGLTMVTLTMRHNRGDPLKVTLDAALTAYRRLMQGRAWSDFKAYNGIVGWVRAVEVTYGENGWHPHIHALFFTEKPIVERRASEWSSWLYGRWARYVVERGGKMPNRLHGVDVRIADRGGLVVGQYLAKIQEKAEKAPTKLAAEMARFDFKTGRGAGLMPFELLDSERWADVDDSDSVAARALWVEYVKATRA